MPPDKFALELIPQVFWFAICKPTINMHDFQTIQRFPLGLPTKKSPAIAPDEGLGGVCFPTGGLSGSGSGCLEFETH